MKNISPKTVEQWLLEDKPITIIDVREEDETISGIIPKAINIPLSELHLHMNELDKNNEYVLVCHSGARSHLAAQFLHQHGFNVSNMVGGMMAWFGPIQFK